MNIKNNKMKKKDIPELVRLVKGERAIEDYPGEYSNKVFEKMLKDKDTIVFVIKDNGKIIGFQEFKFDESQKRVFIETILIAKHCRKKGIAIKLIKEVEKIAKKRKYKRISFVVRKWNKAMNNLAKRLNFVPKDELILWDKKLK